MGFVIGMIACVSCVIVMFSVTIIGNILIGKKFK